MSDKETGKRDLSYQDLLQLVELVKTTSRFTEFRLKVGDIEVEMKRDRTELPPTAAANVAPAHAGELVAAAVDASDLAASRQSRAADEEFPAGALLVRAPMVGTVYRAPAPGARTFVAVGDEVKPDTITCIIEVMKLMNSIPAGYDGVVSRILFEDTHMV